jgi:hypothetical protein
LAALSLMQLQQRLLLLLTRHCQFEPEVGLLAQAV